MGNTWLMILPLGVICSLLLVSIINMNSVYAVNWGELCRNSIIDAVVAEPCETLIQFPIF